MSFRALLGVPSAIIVVALAACSGGAEADSAAPPEDHGSGVSKTVDAGADARTSAPPAVTKCTPAPGRLDLGDVSFLFPLPTSLGATGAPGQLLTLSAAGAHGPLLSTALADALPKPLSTFPASTIADVRILGARVDPCFTLGKPGSACLPQIRLVGQPLIVQSGTVHTVDATVHLFYTLRQAQLAPLVTRLRALKKLAGAATDCKPLGVHPVLAKQGLDGAYAKELEALILELCGVDDLTRVAVMQVGRPGGAWTFTPLNVKNGALQPDPIPLLNEPSQAFTVSDTAIDTAAFVTAAQRKLPLLLRAKELQSASAKDVEAAVAEAFAVENPRREGPGTVDCVSCHVADRGRARAAAARSVTLPTATERYLNAGFDLSLIDDGQKLGSQRAFGYFSEKPSLTQRVINESAEVASLINAMP